MTSKQLIYREGLPERLSDYTLIVDSTALIDASNKPIFMEFLLTLAQNDCILATIPSVLYEFKRGAKNLSQLEIFNEIIKNLEIQIVPNVEDKAQQEENQIFTAIYNIEAFGRRKEKGPSYTDSLLCLLLYMYRHANVKLLTTNYKDVPLSLFNRDELIIYDTGNEVRTAAIYSLSDEKLNNRLETLANT